jgi:hypothetical protein
MLPAVEAKASLIPLKGNDQRQTSPCANIPVKFKSIHGTSAQSSVFYPVQDVHEQVTGWNLDATKEAALIDIPADRPHLAMRDCAAGPWPRTCFVVGRGPRGRLGRVAGVQLAEPPRGLWRICCVASPPPKSQNVHDIM